MGWLVVAAKVVGAFLTANTLTGMIVRTVLLTAAQIGLSRTKKPKQQHQPDQGLELTKRIVVDHPIEVLFGETATPGSLSWWGIRGTNNDYFEQVLWLSDQSCDSVVGVDGDGQALTFSSSLIAGYAACTSHYLDEAGNPCLWIKVYLGDPDQLADADLVANYDEITTDFRGRHKTYAITRMKWNRDAYPQGEPSLLFRMRGVPVYDPRLDSTVLGGSGAHRSEDASTWTWSANDGLVSGQYTSGFFVNGKLLCGMGFDRARIPDAELIASANECEEQVTLDAGETEDRYRAGGSFLVGKNGRTHSANIQMLLDAMDGELDDGAGRAIRFLPGGERAPTGVVIAWSDIVATGEIQLEPDLEPAEKINGIDGAFTDPASAYELGDVPLRQPAAYVAADGGQEFTASPTLLAVNSYTQAQRVLKRKLEKARAPRRVSLMLPLVYARFQKGDRVAFDSELVARLNLPETSWRVEQRPSITPNLAVSFVFREHPDAIGNWTPSTDELARSASSLAGPGIPVLALTGVNIAAVELSEGAARIPVIRLSWTAGDPRVTVSVQCVRLDGDDVPVVPAQSIAGATPASNSEIDLQVVPGGKYKVLYALRYGGRFASLTTVSASITATGNLEPTGINGVAAANIAAVADDGTLTPAEKNLIVPYLQGLLGEQTALEARAAAYSVSTATYTAAVDALSTYLAALTSPVLWSELTGNTTIIAADWVANIQAVQLAKDALVDVVETASGRGNVSVISGLIGGIGTGDGTAIGNGLVSIGSDGVLAGAGGGTVTLPGIGGGALASLDNVTLALVTDAGGLASLDDITLALVTDSGGLASVDYVRAGVDVRANDGVTVLADADLRNSLQEWTDLQAIPANLAALTGSEGINNASVSIGSDGVLAGAGGGAVTLAGIGGGALAVLDNITVSLITDAGALAGKNSIAAADLDANAVTVLGNNKAVDEVPTSGSPTTSSSLSLVSVSVTLAAGDEVAIRGDFSRIDFRSIAAPYVRVLNTSTVYEMDAFIRLKRGSTVLASTPLRDATDPINVNSDTPWHVDIDNISEFLVSENDDAHGGGVVTYSIVVETFRTGAATALNADFYYEHLGRHIAVLGVKDR
jgi:hypothetical protein